MLTRVVFLNDSIGIFFLDEKIDVFFLDDNVDIKNDKYQSN